MPNQRAPGQKLLPIPARVEFIRQVDAGIVKAGYTNRSQFIRDAIVEKLERASVRISRELSQPPPRTGKGGRPRGKAAKKKAARRR